MWRCHAGAGRLPSEDGKCMDDGKAEYLGMVKELKDPQRPI